MGTTKKRTVQAGKSGTKAGREEGKTPQRPQRSAAYEAALRRFTEALGRFHRGAYGEAVEAFRDVGAVSNDEPVLAARARTYLAVCERKLLGEAYQPQSAEERYRLGVARANEGRLDEALRLLDQAVEEGPSYAAYLYARASTHALLRNALASATDLKRAMEIEPHLRFQATNDPDFEPVRDDPVFIDVIEPTTSGV